MKRVFSHSKRLLAIGMPIALGLIVLVLMVRSRKPPAREEVVERALPVRVITASVGEYIPRITGFGTVEPDQVWNAVAEVGGKVIAVHPEFEIGALLAVDTVLLEIDPAEFEIAVARSTAQVKAVSAQIAELDQEKVNLGKRLHLERRNLALSEREFRRNLSLVRDGSVSESLLEQAERNLLQQELQITNLENSLATLPSRHDQLAAQLLREKASLRDAERRLGQTKIRMPFTGRVAAKHIELGQAAIMGAKLAEAHGISRAEVKAGFALEKLAGIVSAQPNFAGSGVLDMQVLLPQSEITPVVRLRSSELPVEWEATFTRIDAALDPGTRTTGVFVAVEDPYGQARIGGRPPLVKGMYCEVELRGTPRDAITIPRAAIRGGKVWIAGQDNRLQSREVRIRGAFGQIAEIEKGINAGERIVVSDIAPAVVGMLLAPSEDESLADEVARVAAGGGAQ